MTTTAVTGTLGERSAAKLMRKLMHLVADGEILFPTFGGALPQSA